MRDVIEVITKAEGQVAEERLRIEREIAELKEANAQQIVATKEHHQLELAERQARLIEEQQQDVQALRGANEALLGATFATLAKQMADKKEDVVGNILKEVQRLYGHF